MTSDPYKKDILTRPNTKEIEGQDWERLKLAYLTKDLFDLDERNEIIEKVTSSAQVKSWSVGDTAQLATTSQMLSDLTVGQFNSSTGVYISSAVFVGLSLANMFSGQDGAKYTSKFWIPQSKGIETAEQASKYLYFAHMERVETVARYLGASYDCLFECKPGQMIIRFNDIDTSKLPKDYLYTHKDMYVQINYTIPEAVAEDDKIHAVLGYQAKWATKGYNSNLVQFSQPTVFDEDGLPLVSDHNGITVLSKVWPVNKTHLGRDLLEIYYDTPEMIFGHSTTYPSYVFYNGKKYAFRPSDDQVNLLVDEDNLLKIN